MENPLFKRERKKAQQSNGYHRSPKQEKELVNRIKAWRTPGSGSGKTKGDVQSVNICRIECKTTERKSFSVTREMVEKIENAAIASGEFPAIVVEFIDKAGKPECEVAVVPMYVLQRLIANADA